MDWLSWVSLAVAVVIGVGVIAWKIIQVMNMSAEERKETVTQWLISAVVAAEAAIKESGAGAEKMQMVLDHFKQNAPALYKIMLKLTKDVDLEELVEKALALVKENFGE